MTKRDIKIVKCEICGAEEISYKADISAFFVNTITNSNPIHYKHVCTTCHAHIEQAAVDAVDQLVEQNKTREG